MNGDTDSGAMSEPTPATNEKDCVLEPNKENSEIFDNGPSSNYAKTGSHKNEDSIGFTTNNSDDTLQCSPHADVNNSNDVPNVEVYNKDDPTDLQTDFNNDSSHDKKCSQETVHSYSKENPLEQQLLSVKDGHCEDSLESSQDGETNDASHLPMEVHSINGLESNHNSDDDLSDSKDTVGDTNTMSSGETEREILCDQTNLGNGDLKRETFQIVAINRHHSDDEMETSSDDIGSETELKEEDAVSIHSGSDDLVTGDDLHNDSKMKSSEIIILENDGNDTNDTHNEISKTSDVLEICSDNDDCIMTDEDKVTKQKNTPIKRKRRSNNTATNVELRRSSRTIKRKKYDDDIQPLDDESDIEEVIMEDPLNTKTNKIIVNETKTLVETIGKPVKSKSNKSSVIIIDSPEAKKNQSLPVNKPSNSTLNQNICQRIVSRGISVTPVTTKNMATQSTLAPSIPVAPILPTLTDEMFVVEAPSFIVPYVYEKPAVMPFKEFVDKWGKEIEEEKVEEEKVLLEKKKEQKAIREKERQEKRERGEEVVESEDELKDDEIKKKKAEKAERKERRRRKKEDDDVSWDGSSMEESDDSISDDDSQVTILKDKADSVGEVQDVTHATVGPTTKSDSYFDLCLGKFFMNIGLSLVQEYVQTDLLNQQNRKLQREKRGGHDTKNRQVSIALLTKNLENSKKINTSLTFEQKKCEFCSFKTESALAMAHHLETPHMKNNLYICNYCSFEVRSPHDILFHMEKEHRVKGKLERTPAIHQCPNCPFEDHGKGKLARHLIACAKKFKPESNLAPPAEWEHPAKIIKVARARGNSAPYHVSHFGRHHVDTVSNVRIPIANALAGPSQGYRARAPAMASRPVGSLAPSRPSGILIRPGPLPHAAFPVGNVKKSTQQSMSITPLARPGIHPSHPANAKGFVMCEICDGYIKDLEQLRNHMQWIHKVKIHPKMIYNRPPLNCQKCQFRFFTDQGLERHLLGSHGLVTSSIQEAANKGKDAGRCPVCGRVYQWKLLGHVSRDHNLVLKPAHLSYKCTVCTATFGMYRQFENHVYSAHSVVAKKVMEKKSNAAIARANDNAAKQLKISDQITITPQPVKMAGPSKGK